MKGKIVKVLKTPISERYCKVGDEAILDTKNKQIRCGGAWFNFDDRWVVTNFIKKTKIGIGFQQCGYGRGFLKNKIVWEINGKAYVKMKKATFETDLAGHVMVNQYKIEDRIFFSEVGLISEHKLLNKE